MLENESIGDYQSHEPMESGWRITAENAVAEVTVYSPGVFRIHIHNEAHRPAPFSYAVIRKPEPTDVGIVDNETFIVIRTRRLYLHVDKYPLRFSFYTSAGDILNADDHAFGTSWIGDTITTYKRLQEGERFVGLGEKTGDLDRRGSAYVNWNTDHTAYPITADPLYTSVGFYMGIHNGQVYGIYLDNTHRSRFNFGAGNDRFSSFAAEDGSMDYYFIHGPSVADILYEYGCLTGFMPLPPLWSLGYQQCRYSYYPDSEVLEIARMLRARDIPADVIYLDIHYMDSYKVFTWDEKRFPDPGRLVAALHELGFRVVAIVDPGIKVETGYAPLEEGKEKDLFLKYPDGETYVASVWPGPCHFPDFTSSETRKWWKKWLRTLTDPCVDGFWNDMNEPSVWGKEIPDLVTFHFEGHGAVQKTARNIYGMQMARSTYEGALDHMTQRPFVLTRSGYAGVQRYSAVWTGDNVADDGHMMAGVRMVNSMGLSGMSFSGYDISGFAGDSDPALFARWTTLGMFTPLARNHSAVNTRAAEPWAYGEETEAIARNYARLRYRLLPYIYSAFYESTRSGLPVARSLAIEHPHDPMIYERDYQHEYLFGPAILVCAVSSRKEIAKVYLPAGGWYDFYTDHYFPDNAGGSEIHVETPVARLPLFVREGAIIPMDPGVSSTSELPGGPLQFHVYCHEGINRTVYYEDDGESFDYRNGMYHRRTMVLEKNRLLFQEAEGDFDSIYHELVIYFHGFDFPKVKALRVNGEVHQAESGEFRLCEPVSATDPAGAASDPYGSAEVHMVSLENQRRRIEITW